jgi:hypothetical protein
MVVALLGMEELQSSPLKRMNILCLRPPPFMKRVSDRVTQITNWKGGEEKW